MPEFDHSSLSVDDPDFAVLIYGAQGTLEVSFLILRPCICSRLLVRRPQDVLLIDVLANYDYLEDVVKVLSDQGLNEVSLVEEATFEILLEVFRILILGRKQVPEDAVLRDVNRAELFVEAGVTHLEAKEPL